MEYNDPRTTGPETLFPDFFPEEFRYDTPVSAENPQTPSAPSTNSEAVRIVESLEQEISHIYDNSTSIVNMSSNVELASPIDHTDQNQSAETLSLMESVRIKFKELLGANEYETRPTTIEDIDTLVSIDIQAFRAVYKDYGMTEEELRNDLTEKFTHRFNKVGGNWMPILEREGKPVGFMVCCPTNNRPEDFESWEKTTDNGTLESTYDPNGKYVYIVSLSMLPEGSRQQGQNMLFANQIANFISEGREKAFFESRMPGLRRWVEAQCAENGENIDDLSEERKLELANTYFNLKKTVKGKEVPYDHLLHIYSSAGCKLKQVFANAYVDEPSMNFGVMCEFENPVPKALRIKPINKGLASVIKIASRSHKLMQKLF